MNVIKIQTTYQKLENSILQPAGGEKLNSLQKEL
jgi:hypothetical protein